MKISLLLNLCSYFLLLEIGLVNGQESEQQFQFETLNPDTTKIQFKFSKTQRSHTIIYQFTNYHPRDLIAQLQDTQNQVENNQQKPYDIIINIYEYPSQKECEFGIKEKEKNLSFSDENLIANLSTSHQVNHIRFFDDYFYIIYATFNLQKLANTEIEYQPGEGGSSTNQDVTIEYSPTLVLRFLVDNPSCDNNGNYDETEGRCVCYKNKFGRFCEYDVQQITNYYPFEIQLKPFDGKYYQIYKISLEDEIKVEMNIKRSSYSTINMYRSDNSVWFPTQYLYFEKLVFNSTNKYNIIPADSTDNSIILFIRNPSNEQLYVTLSLKNVTMIDDTNIIFFIMISLVVTLAVSFLCIFCFNKISNGSKRTHNKHVELQDTKEENKDQRSNNQNGTNPQTNRNLLDEIKTQRENQIKSEMDQITKGNKYEQFQLENSFKEQICAICLDDFEYDDVVRKTKCNHMFHEKCLYKWLFKYISCPMCNQDLT